MTTHLSFDLWGTLITSNPSYKAQRNALLNEVFGVNVSPEDLRTGKGMVDEISEASGIQLTYAQTIAVMLGGQLKITDKKLFDQNVNHFKKMNIALVKDHGPKLISDKILPLLEELKASGYRMNVLSNTSIIPGEMLRLNLGYLGIRDYFDYLFFSDEVGMAKPNLDLYSYMINTMQVHHSKIIHIGDNPNADNGASLIRSFIINESNPIESILNTLKHETRDVQRV